MKEALGLLVVALAASSARAEPYRPLPRLPPGKVESREATGASQVPAPADSSAGQETGQGETSGAPGGASRLAPMSTATGARAATADRLGPEAQPTTGPVRRARRVGPPPPLQDELGRTFVLAAAPPLQDDGGGILEAPEPVHVIVLPSPDRKADDGVPQRRDRRRRGQ
jgi:hypothetical protein